MTTEKGVLRSVVLLVTLFICMTEAQSQAFPNRESSGGTIQGAQTRTATTALLFKSMTSDPLPAGSYTVGIAGYFPSLDSAFTRLSGGGILGPVTLLLTDTLYVASPSRNGEFLLTGPISGAGPSSRITIRPADNVAVTIRGNGNSALGFGNVSYLTLDGISLEGGTRLKVQSELNTVNTWFNSAIVLDGNCDFAVVQNLTASSGDITARPAAGIALYSEMNADPDSCLVSGTSVISGAMGIYVGGLFPSLSNRPRGIVIRGNHIGSPADSLISRGIQLDGVVGALIENNHVENMRLPLKLASNEPQYVTGINAYFSMNTVIRNNAVHGLRGSNGARVQAVLGSGMPTTVGQGLQIYNNMIYDIQNNSTTGSPWAEGIVLWSNANALIAYNTVYLSGSRTRQNAADALALIDFVTNCTIRNNILVNLYRSSAPDSCSALFADETATFTSDHNDLYVDTLWMWTAIRTGLYRTLNQWQGAGYDAHSVSVMPPFRQPFLHIDSTNGVAKSLNWHATPLAAVTHDFDGQPRDALTPDIGADEFSFQKDTVTIWTKDPRNPILTGGASGTWNRHVFMPCVLYNADSSRYEMWFGASFGPGTPNWRPYRIGFAVSKDGSSWTMHPTPVLSPDPGTWEAYTVEQPMVIRENGLYKMWYTGSPDLIYTMIGYATSPDGIHWTKYASNPVMGVGKAAWDAGGPYSCTVMPIQGGYRMWYGAYSSITPYPGCIGQATSPDGVTWQRDTVHNPVIRNGAWYEWDGYWAIIPQVLQLGDTYWMWYTGTASEYGIRCGGEASSSDMGITWNKRLDNPVLTPSYSGWDQTYIEVGTVLRKGKDSLELWYAGAAAPSYTWAIGRATSIFTGISRDVREVPQNFLLSQNYPNPFNPTTAINYEVSLSSFLTLKVYDILGREVATLVNEKKAPGNYTVRFDAAGLASGVYLYRVTAGNFAQTKKMMVVK